jgi:hypothetical protein
LTSFARRLLLRSHSVCGLTIVWNQPENKPFIRRIRGGEIPNIGSMDKRCAPLPGSGEVFGNACGRKPRPLLATGIVDAGARTLDKMKPAGEGKTWRAPIAISSPLAGQAVTTQGVVRLN